MHSIVDVLFEISNSMKPYPTVVHAYVGSVEPVTGFTEPQPFDEVSNRTPPTSQHRCMSLDCHLSTRPREEARYSSKKRKLSALKAICLKEAGASWLRSARKTLSALPLTVAPYQEPNLRPETRS